MTAQKPAGQGASTTRSSTATTAVTTTQSTRKPWKKKTPVEIMLGQIDKIREDVAKKEEEFKQAKRQLEKLEAARKILEAT
jgi:predicted patatin/cPLA2 family phospholipase